MTAEGGWSLSLWREWGWRSRTKEMMVNSPACLSSTSSLLCSFRREGALGFPTKAFFSHTEGASLPQNLLCCVHLQRNHWPLTPTFSQKHTPEVANVMQKQLCSSSVFTGVLSCPPVLPPLYTKQVIVPCWLEETPLTSAALCLCWITGCYSEQDNYWLCIHERFELFIWN